MLLLLELLMPLFIHIVDLVLHFDHRLGLIDRTQLRLGYLVGLIEFDHGLDFGQRLRFLVGPFEKFMFVIEDSKVLEENRLSCQHITQNFIDRF